MCARTTRTLPSVGGCFTDRIGAWLSAWGYRQVEIPTLLPDIVCRSATEGTENRMFEVNGADGVVLAPECTNYIRAAGAKRLGTSKLWYVARCFRNETTTDATRLREFTQIGVEILSDNALDARKVVRADAIRLFNNLDRPAGMVGACWWELVDGPARGLNLYSDSTKTFEVQHTLFGGKRRQLLGGGPYDGGAGWALGLERLMIAEDGLDEPITSDGVATRKRERE